MQKTLKSIKLLLIVIITVVICATFFYYRISIGFGEAIVKTTESIYKLKTTKRHYKTKENIGTLINKASDTL